MNKPFSNPCIRCGKERIVSKTWKEKVGYSYVYNTETICPDADCQKQVNLENKRQRDKKVAMRKVSEERAQKRKEAKTAEIQARKTKS